MREANTRTVVELNLGRSEIQWASEEGLEINSSELRKADRLRITIGPDLRMVSNEHGGKIIDESYEQRRMDDVKEELR